MTAKQIIEKIVDRSVIVPKIYEVERIEEKIVEVPRIVEVEKIVPQLINVNKYIQNIVEKIVEVPVIMERVKEVVKESEKVVEMRNEYETVKEVEKVVEKAVVFEKFKEAVRDINHIEKVLQIVDRIVNVPVEIIAHEERLVEVPYILEKIVEKIVIMPQIVEVLKYVHEVVEEETLGVAVGVDVHTHEQKYKLLTKDIKIQLDLLLVDLRKMRSSNPALQAQVTIIEGFLSQLEQFILFPRIVEVPKIVEKIVEVEKERVVTLPNNDRSLKMELSLSLLVEKLIVELKRIKKTNPSVKYELEEDVSLLFFSELEGTSANLNTDLSHKLKTFSDSVNRKFESLGSWSTDHQLMLNSFLQERFLMANVVKTANSEIELSRTSGLRSVDSLKRSEAEVEAYKGLFGKLKGSLAGVGGIEIDSIVSTIFLEFDKVGAGQELIVKDLGNLSVTDARISSLIREKDSELIRLRDEILRLNKLKTTVNNDVAHNRSVQVITDENNKLKNEINALRVERGSSELISSYKQQVQQLNERILELEQEKSNLSAEVTNLENELKVRLSVQTYNSSVDIKRSAVTDIRGSEISMTSNASKLTSPVQRYNINSGVGSPKDEGFGIKMVDSKIEPSRSPTYGYNESEVSDRSGMQEQASTYGSNIKQVTSAYQTPASSSVSGSSINESGVSGTGVTTSNIYQAGGQTYQAGQGQGATYQASGSSSSYQSGNSGVYQAGSTSGNFQGGTYQAGSTSGSGVYQAGSPSNITGQSGQVQGGQVQGGQVGQSGSYQSNTYQPYQGSYNYQSSSVSGSGLGQSSSGAGSGSTTGTGNTQGGYRYDAPK